MPIMIQKVYKIYIYIYVHRIREKNKPLFLALRLSKLIKGSQLFVIIYSKLHKKNFVHKQ